MEPYPRSNPNLLYSRVNHHLSCIRGTVTEFEVTELKQVDIEHGDPYGHCCNSSTYYGTGLHVKINYQTEAAKGPRETILVLEDDELAEIAIDLLGTLVAGDNVKVTRWNP